MLPLTPNYEEPHLCLPSCINSLKGTSASRSDSSSACTLMRFALSACSFDCYARVLARSAIRLASADRVFARCDSTAAQIAMMSAPAERTIEIALHFQGDDGVVEANLAQVFAALLFCMGGIADVGQGGVLVAAERKDSLVHVDGVEYS